MIYIDDKFVNELDMNDNISNDSEILNFKSKLEKIIKNEKLKKELISKIDLFSVSNCVNVFDNMIIISIRGGNNLSFSVTIRNVDFKYSNGFVSYNFDYDDNIFSISNEGVYEEYCDGSYTIDYSLERIEKRSEWFIKKEKGSSTYDSDEKEIFRNLVKKVINLDKTGKKAVETSELIFKNNSNAIRESEVHVDYDNFIQDGNSSKEYNNVEYSEAFNVAGKGIDEIDDFKEIPFSRFKRKLKQDYSLDHVRIK